MPVAAAKEAEVIARRVRGETLAEIADHFGVTSASVCETLKKPHVRAEIDRINEESYQAIIDQRAHGARVAFATLLRLAEGDPGPMLDVDSEQVFNPDGSPAVEYRVPYTVQRSAASDLLDRCGVTKEVAIRVSKTEDYHVTVEFRSLPPDELDHALEIIEAELAEIEVPEESAELQ